MKRGEVYYLRYDNSMGHEEACGRPVIIVSSQEGIDTSPVIQVVYMTTSFRKNGTCVKLSTPRRQSWAMCNQIDTIDKRKLGNDIMCRLNRDEMSEIDRTLKMVLGLEDEYKPVDTDIELKIEGTIYKRLYEKAIEKIAELKFEKDVRSLKVEPEVVEPEVVEPEKRKRRSKVVVPYDARREDILQYANPSGVANVNTDEWYVIAATSGMRLATARNIVAYRNKHGMFECLEDLIEVNAFSDNMLFKYMNKLEV